VQGASRKALNPFAQALIAAKLALSKPLIFMTNMRGGSFIFLLLIPAFIALGHDCYLFYVNFLETQPLTLALVQKEFKFSALGFIWTSYEPESYKATVDSTDPETWAIIDYLLTYTAFYVGLGFAAAMTVLFGFFGLVFGIGPMAMEDGKIFHASDSKKESFRSGQGNKKFEYKRKK
jgi:hypothetical protein